jgi:tetraspanin-13/31
MCGNFNFSKNALVALNICYIMVAFILIGVATYGKTSAYVDSLPIIGGIAACGVFLLVIAIVGLIGAVRHHQVMLFFYMVVLSVIFILQFSIACSCLAVGEEKEIEYAHTGWNNSDNETRFEAQTLFSCCGFSDHSEGIDCKNIPDCMKGLNASSITEETVFSCPTCEERISVRINYAFNAAGGLGLFFAFTELASLVYAYKFRSQLKEMSELA